MRLAVTLVALVLAAPAAAGQAPEELWREYPLNPTPTSPDGTATPPPRSAPPPQERDVPSSAIGTTPSESDGGGFPIWWLVAATALVAAAAAVVALRRRLEAMPARAAVDAWTRKGGSGTHSNAVRRFAEAAEAARSPVAAPVECVVRREGVVRSRFVAEVQPLAGRQRTIASSRSFWRKGYSTDDREDEARRAWDDLIGGLQADGWEIAPAWGAQKRVEANASAVADEIRLIRTLQVPVVEEADDGPDDGPDPAASPRKGEQGQSRAHQTRRRAKHRRRSGNRR